MNHYQHWKVNQDHDHLVWAYFDKAASSANTLDVPSMMELDQIINEVNADKSCKGLIIGTAKKSGFIMGADIEQFTKIGNAQEGIDFLNTMHAVYNKLEALKVPTVAMIKGFCLGGGTELALSCRYRVVEESFDTRIGLPEVKLGILPGWGGLERMPRLMGGLNAMDLILSGRMIDGKKSFYMGFADVAVPERLLATAAKNAALNGLPKRQLPLLQRMSNYSVLRPVFAKILRKQVMAKASPEHYPAPYAIINHWRKFGASCSKKSFENEIKTAIDLVQGDTSQNLIRVFFLQDRMKKLTKAAKFKAQHVHVIGAGTMGGDIAVWCAFRGMTVTLQDRDYKYIAPAITRAYKFLEKKLKKPRLIQEVMDRLIPDVHGAGVPKADVVIEAIFENLEAKQALFKDLETKMKPTAIMASNTSSIPLDEIGSALKNPARLVGIHFFNPVAMMPLVEVVYAKATDKKIVDEALAFVGQLSKQPVPVKSSPGFLVNRCLMPYLMEAVDLIAEGASGPAIDHAAKKFGMPMGPIELADTVGLDICYHVAENLTKFYGGTVPAQLKALVDAGKLGKKTGEGFYKFEKGKAVKPAASSSLSAKEITDRLILRMLNECAACLREGVVEDKDLLDGGMIFGTGFAPFRGGPMRYADKLGVTEVKTLLNHYEKKCGPRFKADAYWG